MNDCDFRLYASCHHSPSSLIAIVTPADGARATAQIDCKSAAAEIAASTRATAETMIRRRRQGEFLRETLHRRVVSDHAIAATASRANLTGPAASSVSRPRSTIAAACRWNASSSKADAALTAPSV